MSLRILEENAVEGRAVPNAKLGAGGAATRKPRRALGDITNGGAQKKKLGGKRGLGDITNGGGPKSGGLRPKEAAGKPAAAASIDILVQPEPAPAPAAEPEVPDVEHAQLAQDSDEIDWLKDDIGLDMEQLMGNLVGGAAPRSSRAASSNKRGCPAPEARRLGAMRQCGAMFDATVEETFSAQTSSRQTPRHFGAAPFRAAAGARPRGREPRVATHLHQSARELEAVTRWRDPLWRHARTAYESVRGKDCLGARAVQLSGRPARRHGAPVGRGPAPVRAPESGRSGARAR